MKRLFFGLLLLLMGCGSPTPEIEYAEPSAVQVVVAANDFEVGTPRIPFVLFDGIDTAQVEKLTVTTYDLRTDPPQAVWTGDAAEYADYEVAYWVVRPEFDTAMNWGLLLEATLPDGTVEEHQISVQIAEQSSAPNVGDVPPASENRTSATHEISLLTSGKNPVPELYELTVKEALANGRPSVITFATPAFCATKFCTPVVESAEQAYEQFGDQANFIHLEIFKDFQAMTQADEVLEWALASEPWTYVLDANGVITARLGGPISPQELIAAVEHVLK